MSVGDVIGFKINCSLIERSLPFYRRLGFEPVGEAATSSQDWLGVLYGVSDASIRSQALVRADNPKGLRLELLEWGQKAPPAAGVSAVAASVLTLRSNDLAADCAALAGAGGEVVSEPAALKGPAGTTLLVNIRDPDGFTVQLMQFVRAAA